MEQSYRKFFRLLAIELESLKEELELIIESLDLRLERHEITDYVRNENFATLRNEILGLEDCIKGCEDVDVSNAESMDDLVTMTKEFVRTRVAGHGYVPAVYGLIAARIDKVAAYLSVDANGSLV
ncbi:MAG: hypothetical protein GVY29_10415 [Spirochaetes bacterium]|jgi:hypothetical protein|nr:hypothetical protein [Spirochaetota bacterium]